MRCKCGEKALKATYKEADPMCAHCLSYFNEDLDRMDPLDVMYEDEVDEE